MCTCILPGSSGVVSGTMVRALALGRFGPQKQRKYIWKIRPKTNFKL